MHVALAIVHAETNFLFSISTCTKHSEHPAPTQVTLEHAMRCVPSMLIVRGHSSCAPNAEYGT